MRYLAAHAQHIGARRYQQDSLGLADPQNRNFMAHGGFLAVLCDGMGGMEHGDIAREPPIRGPRPSAFIRIADELLKKGLGNG